MTAAAMRGHAGPRDSGPGDGGPGGSGPGGSSPGDNGPGGSGSGSRRLLLTGWLLYTLSWITPSIDGRQFGAVAFVESVRFGWNLLTTNRILPGVAVMLGWLANFSLLPRLPNWLRVVATLAPWLAFAVVLANLPVRPSLPGRAAFFLYFYPWAVGIALIHAARSRSLSD
jgi:hypothetical protein